MLIHTKPFSVSIATKGLCTQVTFPDIGTHILNQNLSVRFEVKNFPNPVIVKSTGKVGRTDPLLARCVVSNSLNSN